MHYTFDQILFDIDTKISRDMYRRYLKRDITHLCFYGSADSAKRKVYFCNEKCADCPIVVSNMHKNNKNNLSHKECIYSYACLVEFQKF